MRLSCMDQEWMAQVNGSRVSGRENLTPRSAFRKASGCELSQRYAALSERSESSRDIEMRSYSNACGRVPLANIGEEKQHQQRPAL